MQNLSPEQLENIALIESLGFVFNPEKSTYFEGIPGKVMMFCFEHINKGNFFIGNQSLRFTDNTLRTLTQHYYFLGISRQEEIHTTESFINQI